MTITITLRGVFCRWLRAAPGKTLTAAEVAEFCAPYRGVPGVRIDVVRA